MKDILPDYKNSIVNLMSSIMEHFNQNNGYKPLKLNLKKKVVLIVIDGMGYDYVMKHGDFFKKNCVKPITSVFPSTTSSAAIVFERGVPPQQTAMTGWFMNLKETGSVGVGLRFMPKLLEVNYADFGFNSREMFETPFIQDVLKVNNSIVFPKKIYPKSKLKGRKKIFTYTTLNGMIRGIKKALKTSKYVYAYYPDFDHIGHEFGLGKESEEEFKKIENTIKKLSVDATVIVTADHGMINNKKYIDVRKMKWYSYLTICLAGEPRCLYCYVRPSKEKDFLKEVKKYKKYWRVYKGEDLIKKKWFGLGKANPKLFDRVGDYVLVMKDKYTAFDTDEVPIGEHAGVSHEEMLVPLIIPKS